MNGGAQAPLVLLAAGGTGGHLFPAEALAGALLARGFRVDLITDHRATGYAGRFPAGEIHVVPADTIRGRNPFKLALTALRLGRGMLQSMALLRRLKPAAVVGFGGYPTLPPMFAARALGVPSVIHDANAVMGRANRLIAKFATAVATGYPGAAAGNLASKSTFTGNPLRPAVMAAADRPYPPLQPDVPIHLVVFGGSQGAQVMSKVVPPAIASLEAPLRVRLRVVQQARADDLAEANAAYVAANVAAELAPFFGDLPERIAAAHLVIGRSGASTVSELAAIGRPSILVPLPHALDQDQKANAESLAAAGGALVMPQAEFTPPQLTSELRGLFSDPARLRAMADAAKRAGRRDAAERLADVVEKVAGVAPSRTSAES
jgi:UDP-N-acetylglucosamine--N-acetylmuramyl-(pentapeptide) pyrophosphoryl-undecaprenol N-acetylglucosamine transferase